MLRTVCRHSAWLAITLTSEAEFKLHPTTLWLGFWTWASLWTSYLTWNFELDLSHSLLPSNCALGIYRWTVHHSSSYRLCIYCWSVHCLFSYGLCIGHFHWSIHRFSWAMKKQKKRITLRIDPNIRCCCWRKNPSWNWSEYRNQSGINFHLSSTLFVIISVANYSSSRSFLNCWFTLLIDSNDYTFIWLLHQQLLFILSNWMCWVTNNIK